MAESHEAFRAGVASEPIALAVDTPMMGYGARTGTSTGVHDPLFARALFVSSPPAGRRVLFVTLDVCLIGPGQADLVRRRISADTGIGSDEIAVTCIHTHSGPDTGLFEFLSGQETPPHADAVFDAAVAAARGAVASATPAELAVGHGTARIGRNRRRADGPLDEDILVLRIDDADGRTRSVIYSHGCHPTALGHENLEFSADWVGAANAEVASAFPGATPIFWLGAHADIDPRTRGLLDLAIEGQSVGVSFEETAVLGGEVGLAVVAAARAAQPVPDPTVYVAERKLAIPTHEPSDDERNRAHEALGEPADAELHVGEMFALEHERTQGLPIDEKRKRLSRVRRYLRGRTAHHFAGSACPDVGVQVVRIGPVQLLLLPAEATVDVGRDWRRRVGHPDAAVLSIANGWLRYLPHRSNFDEPDADFSYEVLMSTLIPEASEQLLDLAEQMLRAQPEVKR